MHSCEGARTAKNKQIIQWREIPAEEDRWHGLVLGIHCPMLKSRIKAAPRTIMKIPNAKVMLLSLCPWIGKKTSRANKGATVTSNTTNIAM